LGSWEQRRDELYDEIAFRKGQVELIEEFIKSAFEPVKLCKLLISVRASLKSIRVAVEAVLAGSNQLNVGVTPLISRIAVRMKFISIIKVPETWVGSVRKASFIMFSARTRDKVSSYSTPEVVDLTWFCSASVRGISTVTSIGFVNR